MPNTEQKIKEVASQIFQEKGFAATKTRDIAEAAGVNLALVNYYFRSKKQLFDLIMMESLRAFFNRLLVVLNDENTSLREKVAQFVNAYMDMLSAQENMATFILTSIREHPEGYVKKLGLLDKAKNSVFVRQFQEGMEKGEIPPINPVHFLLNLLGLVVFPFIAQPIVSASSGIPKQVFFEMIQERKRLIPLWIESMLTVK